MIRLVSFRWLHSNRKNAVATKRYLLFLDEVIY
jgi:hypothetical protein